MTLSLPAKMIGAMLAHAYEDLPNECCGLITSLDDSPEAFYRIRNDSSSPFRYTMNGQDVIDVMRDIDYDDGRIMVVYHSHVASKAYPSRTDVIDSLWPSSDFPIFPNAHYVVMSLKDRTAPLVRAFRIVNGKIRRERLEQEWPS